MRFEICGLKLKVESKMIPKFLTSVEYGIIVSMQMMEKESMGCQCTIDRDVCHQHRYGSLVGDWRLCREEKGYQY